MQIKKTIKKNIKVVYEYKTQQEKCCWQTPSYHYHSSRASSFGLMLFQGHIGQNSSSLLSFESRLLLESLLLASFIANRCLISCILSVYYLLKFSRNSSIFSISGLLLYLEKNFLISDYCYFLTLSNTFFSLALIYFLYSTLLTVYPMTQGCLYISSNTIRSLGLGLSSFSIKSEIK